MFFVQPFNLTLLHSFFVSMAGFSTLMPSEWHKNIHNGPVEAKNPISTPG